jgi:hypothetical protein
VRATAHLDLWCFSHAATISSACRRVWGERLLEEDVRPELGARDDHVAVAVGPPVGHADDLRLLLFEHLPEVGVGVLRPEPLRGRGAAGLVLVGHRDDLGPVALEPDGVERVTVAALAGAADHGDAVLLGHGRLRRSEARSFEFKVQSWSPGRLVPKGLNSKLLNSG